jgi:hypothetical protein
MSAMPKKNAHDVILDARKILTLLMFAGADVHARHEQMGQGNRPQHCVRQLSIVSRHIHRLRT